ncbi:patatin-like phospholipase family protein [Pleionea sediminis]|uniref:patatin-like phospholipase family protein n=1 Tax=Pleionea sediminis TaxID=2569479 RepID=UPI001FEB32FD|nr:patatin-like phospholipase family protein [Pleionea sediminis]
MTLHNWLQEKPFTLTMSSGFFGFFAHAGVLSALAEHNLFPAKVTGSSAGALVVSLWASGVESEVIEQQLYELSKDDFWDPWPGLGLLRGKKFKRKLSELLGCMEFEQCRVPLALSVWDGFARRTRVLKSGSLVDAIYASCAVPFLFHPLWQKGRLYWDGGIGDRPGLAGTDSQERVFYHHIASRSPWRSKTSEVLKLPFRENLVSLVLEDINRSGPDKLHLGPGIYQESKRLAIIALGRTFDDSRAVRMSAEQD